MNTGGLCPICASEYTPFLQNVVGTRTSIRFPQFYCMDCQSFFHRSGYKETEDVKASDFEYLREQTENHKSIQSRLVHEIISRAPGIKTVLEVGHGMGWFLDACRNFGLRPSGFEVNANCHQFVRDTLKLDATLGLFDDSHDQTYDLIASIMVFEHLEEPRKLFKTMVSKLNRDGTIYLSVPFARRTDWRFLWTAGDNPSVYPDIFYDNDVHINHFSVDGMKRMGLGLGAISAEYFISADTFFNSPGSYNGVLFRF